MLVTSSNFIEKSANIASKIWPAVRLAANLIPKATGRETLLINSIETKSGDINNGAPEGIKLLKKSNLWVPNPTIMTLNQTMSAKPKVIDIWVVGVNV